MATLQLTSQVDLEHVMQGLPEVTLLRYKELRQGVHNESLTDEEREELAQLTDQVELHDAERLRALVELASLRGVALDKLMQQLGIRSPIPYT